MKSVVFLLGFMTSLWLANINLMVSLADSFYHTTLPFFGLSCYYLFVMSYFAFPKVRKQVKWKRFLFAQVCGLIDFVGNILQVISLKYTNTASVTLFFGLTSPISMVFSFFMMKYRFSIYQILSCMFAVACAGIYAFLDSSGSNGSNPVLGGVLITIAVCCFGFGSVINEKYSKGLTPNAFQAQISVSPLIFAVILCASLEGKQLMVIDPMGLLCMLGYSACMIIFYLSYFALLKHANAVFYNITLVFASFFSFAYALIIFDAIFPWYIAFPIAGLALGVALYVFFTMRKEKLESSVQLRKNARIVEHDEAMSLLANKSPEQTDSVNTV